jgi:hypothetical protein
MREKHGGVHVVEGKPGRKYNGMGSLRDAEGACVCIRRGVDDDKVEACRQLEGLLDAAEALDGYRALDVVLQPASLPVKALTAERLRLVQRVRARSSSITALAAALKRDPKSVRRDVLKLERAGVVRTREQINPGHGRVKIVEPVAREYRLTAVL